MGRQRIEHHATSTADPATVFSLLREGATWPSWSPIESVELERQGAHEPEGIGAVRVLRRGRVEGRDTIAELRGHGDPLGVELRTEDPRHGPADPPRDRRLHRRDDERARRGRGQRG
jgi:hypothetical protein